MIFRQLFDEESCTYTYVVADARGGAAAIFDPVRDNVAAYEALLRELGVSLVASAETHTHADHVTAASTLRDRFGCELYISHHAKATCADHVLRHGDSLRIGALELRVLETPGHTPCSLSFVIGDRVLTGDSLFVGGCGRTDFQQGDASALYDSITRTLFALPDDTLVYPGHDYSGNTVSTIKQEKAKNPRIAGKSRAEFMAIMDGLKLAPPRKIAEALPANEHCGRG